MISVEQLKEYQDRAASNAFIGLSESFAEKFESAVKQRIDSWPYIQEVSMELTNEEYQVRAVLKRWIVEFGYDVSYNEENFTVTISWK